MVLRSVAATGARNETQGGAPRGGPPLKPQAGPILKRRNDMTARERRNLAVFSHGELIGDAMMKLPFVHALRTAFPDRRIVWIATESSQLETGAAGLLPPGAVDQFVCGTGWGERPGDLLGAPPTSERFDLTIDTQNLWWRSLLARRINRGAFISSIAGWRFSARKPAAGNRKPRHVLDRLLALVEAAAGAAVVPPRLRDCVVLPAGAEADAARLLPDGPACVALAPGAGKRVKCWPLDRFIALARLQQAAGRTPVFLLGPAETEWLAPLRDAAPGALFPLQADETAEPRYTAARTVAVARRCIAGVGADCGLNNMLGVADIPLVSLFGPTSGAKLHPRATTAVWLQAQDFAPGSAMTNIPVQAAADALDKLLSETGRT